MIIGNNAYPVISLSQTLCNHFASGRHGPDTEHGRQQVEVMKQLIVAVFTFLAITCASAAQLRPVSEIDIDAITDDTQAVPSNVGDDHAAFVWWIPIEYWQSVMSRDTTASEVDKKTLLDAMSGISLLALVQADISAMGAFRYYAKEEIEQQMRISFTDANGITHGLSPLQAIDPDLDLFIGIFKPILGAAMGNLGSNMHFYVLDDRSESAPRLIEPYRNGAIRVELAKKSGDRLTAEIELPLNSLFIPRKCPNGKEAHISWKFCPWSGAPLE
jgi:hypothetical protein